VVESDFGGFRSIAATLAVGMTVVLAVAKHRQAKKPGSRAERVR